MTKRCQLKSAKCQPSSSLSFFVKCSSSLSLSSATLSLVSAIASYSYPTSIPLVQSFQPQFQKIQIVVMDIDSLPAPQFGSSGGCYSSEIGRQSTHPHANSFEDEFASKTSLMADGGCGSFISNIENRKEEDSDLDECILDGITFVDSSEEDDEARGLYFRSVVENGQSVEKPANQWLVILKGGPPEGCDERTYHLDILKQVVGRCHSGGGGVDIGSPHPYPPSKTSTHTRLICPLPIYSYDFIQYFLSKSSSWTF